MTPCMWNSKFPCREEQAKQSGKPSILPPGNPRCAASCTLFWAGAARGLEMTGGPPGFQLCDRKLAVFCRAASLFSHLRQIMLILRMKKTYGGFSRRGPDFVTEELAAVLSRKSSFEFKALFDIVHCNLRERKVASGGEEMLRLRAYEKL